MGFFADFDPTNNILRITLEGHLTDAVAFDCADKVGAFSASQPPTNTIVDLSSTTKYDVSPEAIRRLARTPPSTSPTTQTLVVVAPKANAYGMSRMFQMMTEGTRPNQHVVRSMDEAYKLLGVKSPDFRPLNWDR